MFMVLIVSGQNKKIYVIGAGAESTIETQDQLLVDSIKQYVDVTYTDQKTFNSDTTSLKYDGFDGVVILESVNSKTLVNFGVDEKFPVPCITMEAGLLTTWGLFSAEGGIWPYAGNDCENIDLQWNVADAEHPVMHWAGDYKNGDVFAWSTHPDPKTYGVPYPHGLTSTIKIIATAARSNKGTNSANSSFIQAEALTIFEIPSIKLLYMCGSKGYIENYATQDFFNILHEVVLYMFDPRPEVADTTSSLSDYKNITGLSLYPNPTTGMTIVSFEGTTSSKITLSNINGIKVAEFILQNNKAYIETSQFASGIYFVTGGSKTLMLVIN